jgi:lipopolysaccharide export system permease protein
LKFELFNGYNYSEGEKTESGLASNKSKQESLSRSKFSKMQVVFDLSSFQLQTTDKKWFQGNRIMRNLAELGSDMDSVKSQILYQRLNYYLYKPTYFNYYLKKDSLIMPKEVYRQRVIRDSITALPYREKMRKDTVSLKPKNNVVIKDSAVKKVLRTDSAVKNNKVQTPEPKKSKPLFEKKTSIAKKLQPPSGRVKPLVKPAIKPALIPKKVVLTDSARLAKIDSIQKLPLTRETISGATNLARQVKSQVMNSNLSVDNYQKELAVFEIQWHKILASSFACIAMFLIGAPLGAIIKKGGLGVPFLVSIFFFIIYYVITMQGEKLAKQNTISVAAGVWAADIVLFVIGLIFLRQARVDARLFEADFYAVLMDKVKQWRFRRTHPQPKTA